MNSVKLFFTFAMALALGACTSTAEVAYSPDVRSPIAFAKKVINDMQIGVQRYSTRLSFSESAVGNLRNFEGDMWPEAGTPAVYSSFENFCKGLGGEFEQGLCASSSSYEAYFLLQHRNYDSVVAGTRKIRIQVTEPARGATQELYQWAANRGKKSRYQKRVEQVAAQKLSAQQAEKNRQRLEQERIQQQRAYNVELEKRRQLSVRTAALVFEKGTPVCAVDPKSKLCGRYKCITEDSNKNTSRIKISFLDNLLWVNAGEFFACP